jgi:uracil-DNA glycosylase
VAKTPRGPGLRSAAIGARSGQRRSRGQVSKTSSPGSGRRASDPRPDPSAANGSLSALRDAAKDCRACDLYKRGTQTVFGEGPRQAEVMLVGEQPGDAEDLAGHPFVGPAGKLLDRALEDAGIDRRLVYVTNVVKHFKWEPRGKRRIHAKPNGSEIAACRPWLETEIALLKPRVLVCLGATAAQALLGTSFKVTRQRGTFVPSALAPRVTATVHPSSILRAPDDESRRAEMRRFVQDLRRVAAELRQE